MSRRWWLLPPLLVVAVLSPMLFTSRSFDSDFTNHMWLVLVQHDAIATHGHPSWFLHASGLGVFYPEFAFYGGTLYGSAGLLSFLLGVQGAYIAFFAIGLAMSFGGWTWLARRLGVPGALAMVPAVLWVTAAYVMANAYGRGAWPEFVASNSLPLMIAAVWALLTSSAIRFWPAAALVVSTVFFTGSHNITLVWGTVFLAALGLVVLLALGVRSARGLPVRRVLSIGGLLLLGVGVNAWFLLPDLVWAQRIHEDAYDNGASFFNTIAVVLNPIRRVPSESTSPGLTAQAPVLALLWALVALGVARPWRERAGRAVTRVAIALCVLLAGFLILVLRDDPTVGPIGQEAWRHVPHFLRYLQFAFRLETYVTILVIGLVVLGLVVVARMAAGRTRTGLTAAIVAIAAISTYQAIHQAWRQPSFRETRSFVAASGPHKPPVSWADPGNFRDRYAPVVPFREGREAMLPPKQMAEDGTARIRVPAGPDTFRINVAAGTYIVSVEGLRLVGRDSYGLAIAQRPDGGSGPVEVKVKPVKTGVLRDGPVITLASLAALLALAAGAALRHARRRRRRVRRARAAPA